MKPANEHESERVEDSAFEARLAGQPLRRLPAAWRADILGAAGEAAPRSVASAAGRNPREGGWLEELLRRFPVAWTALAAAWVFILAANSTDRWLNGPVTGPLHALSAAQIAEARAQRAELWTLAGLDRESAQAPEPADRPRNPVLRPRSSLRHASGPDLGTFNSGGMTSYEVAAEISPSRLGRLLIDADSPTPIVDYAVRHGFGWKAALA